MRERGRRKGGRHKKEEREKTREGKGHEGRGQKRGETRRFWLPFSSNNVHAQIQLLTSNLTIRIGYHWHFKYFIDIKIPPKLFNPNFHIGNYI